MPYINPNLVPLVNPGNLFAAFTETPGSLNVRWLTPGDPAYYEAINRPMGDLALRQLIVAKSLDSLNFALGSQAAFPFVVQPQVESGAVTMDVPTRIFWDFHVSLPVRWSSIRLARIDRISGENGTSYTGVLRFIFTGQRELDGGSESTSETALFYADYTIDSDVIYQVVRIAPATASSVPGMFVIPAGETVGFDGQIIFRTIDTTAAENTALFDLLQPGSTYQYEIVNSSGTAPDFANETVSHGTGMLTSSAFNYIPPIESDPTTWLEAFNYPYAIDASLNATDSSGLTIPKAMFSEFNITAPAGDEPTDTSVGSYFPVWVNKIVRDGGATIPTLVFHFSTNSINDTGTGPIPVEFATLTLNSTMTAGQVVGIVPNNHLFNGLTGNNWDQEFGRGHVVLSGKWGPGGEVAAFFDAFPNILGASPEVVFSSATTRIAAMGISRAPRYSPTAGQAEAMQGTASNPSSTNRFVSEADEGQGAVVDFNAIGVTPNAAIDRYGYMATRAHKLVKLVVDPVTADSDPNFYTQQLLPRLQTLLGRSPIFGDMWYNGNRFMTYNGDSWVG